MARPKKDTAQKRDCMIRFRVNKSELLQFKQAADNAGLSVSDFVRVKSVAALPRHRKATPERAALIRGLAELGKIGSNLNQIARSLNRKALTDGNSFMPDNAQISHALAGADALTLHLIKLLENGH